MADKTSTGEKPVLVQRVDKVDTLLDGEVNYTIKCNTLGK